MASWLCAVVDRSYAVVSNAVGSWTFLHSGYTSWRAAAYHRLTARRRTCPRWSFRRSASRAYHRDEADIILPANEVRERRFQRRITFGLPRPAGHADPLQLDPSRYPDPTA